jgi:hypothetical protein
MIAPAYLLYSVRRIVSNEYFFWPFLCGIEIEFLSVVAAFSCDLAGLTGFIMTSCSYCLLLVASVPKGFPASSPVLPVSVPYKSGILKDSRQMKPSAIAKRLLRRYSRNFTDIVHPRTEANPNYQVLSIF